MPADGYGYAKYEVVLAANTAFAYRTSNTHPTVPRLKVSLRTMAMSNSEGVGLLATQETIHHRIDVHGGQSLFRDENKAGVKYQRQFYWALLQIGDQKQVTIVEGQ
ncbi:hypothetical protein BGAL_0224g00090 [Botrytis galanthina]|uniref:Uncharacterized protein n=1 Tax=Botrytis galanthina TaxID=278940 RepID=A0A4S8QU74_9HELO|nr:hypothetical protein BGAL_0224g00090 [Botrytis galanthina]